MDLPVRMEKRHLPIDDYVERLARMTYQERRQAIEAEPLPQNIGALLDQAAAEVGDQPAWNFFESKITTTYSELVAEVNRTANGLMAWGVARGTHVAVMLPNIPTMPTIWLALARIGAVMVPVNTRYTARELRYITNDSDATFLIVHAEHVDLLSPAHDMEGEALAIPPERIAIVGAATKPPYARFDDLTKGRSAQLALDYTVEATELMNIQYTSGTTGFPKGCMLTQEYWLSSGKVNGVRDGRRYERVFASTPFFYLDPQWLLILTFYQRATLVVAYRQSASRFVSWLHEHKIHFCLFPEVVYKQPPTPLDGQLVLRRANIYGVRKEIHADLRRRFNVPAMEAFGMTEVGPAIYVPLEETQMVGSGSCGIPAPFRECRIVDETGKDVPRGEIGELIIRGPGIMLGYYKKPEANKDSFFGEWFRTGDLFRQDEAGFFYIVGRLKDMVRRAGENIAAREVEAVLKNMPEIVDAAIIPVPDDTRGQEVKAYIVLKDGLTVNDELIGAIFEHCQVNLAAFKVPRYVEFIDALPRTPSEKVAKGELLKAKSNLRVGAFDRIENRWHQEME
ncbi:class I adenylate-forming enzyme family protein [Sneathiella sp.]|uniref:class I adenylate-forming enzyme family protein n=1 Tax=Sneathiella sp. TaxID=1964365 RepID=UPI002FE01CC0